QNLELYSRRTAVLDDPLDLLICRRWQGNQDALDVVALDNTGQRIGRAHNLDPVNLDSNLAGIIIDDRDGIAAATSVLPKVSYQAGPLRPGAHDKGALLAGMALDSFGVGA